MFIKEKYRQKSPISPWAIRQDFQNFQANYDLILFFPSFRSRIYIKCYRHSGDLIQNFSKTLTVQKLKIITSHTRSSLMKVQPKIFLVSLSSGFELVIPRIDFKRSTNFTAYIQIKLNLTEYFKQVDFNIRGKYSVTFFNLFRNSILNLFEIVYLVNLQKFGLRSIKNIHQGKFLCDS